MNSLPNAKDLANRFFRDGDNLAYPTLSNQLKVVRESIAFWEDAARVFKIKPHNIEDSRYLQLIVLKDLIVDLIKLVEGKYTVTVPDKVHTVYGEADA